MSDAAAGGWRRELADLAAGRGTVAKLAGVRVSLHWTLPPFVAALLFWWPIRYTTWPWWTFCEIVGIYALILLPHELGHAAAGRSLGLEVREVILWPLGGLATTAPPATWRAELWLAGAGPLVNVLLGPLFFVARHRYGRGGDAGQLLGHWGWINVAVLALNLLPIWPLDGGRMFQAVLGRWLGRTRAWAATGTLGLAGAAGLAWASVRFFDPITLVFSAALAWMNLRGLRWSTAMARNRRRFGPSDVAACPHCRRPAVEGPTHSCAACGLAGNAFLHAGRCWACGTDAGEMVCPECGRSSAASNWLVAI